MDCASCGTAFTDSALFCPGCGRRITERRPAATSAPAGSPPARAAHTIPRDEAEAALATRHELGDRMEPEVVDAFIDRIEHAIDSRVEARMGRLGRRNRLPAEIRARNFTGRIAASLGIGIPLTAIAGTIAEKDAIVGGIAALGAWIAIIVLNIYYTEVEKQRD
jgi:hypothetical protein